MADETEVIRQQMEETRSALSDKLETLEQQVVSTVQDATTAVAATVENVKEAVEETVETVKDSVQDTVETVRDTFDLRRQTERHPWTMLGGAVAVGYLGGSLFHWLSSGRGSRAEARSFPPPPSNYERPPEAYRTSMVEGVRSAAEPAQPSWLAALGETFKDEINQVKGMAVGALLGMVRDVAVEAVPERMVDTVKETADKLTRKLGGVPFEGPVLPDREPQRSETPGQGLRPETGRPQRGTYGFGQAVGTAHG